MIDPIYTAGLGRKDFTGSWKIRKAMAPTQQSRAARTAMANSGRRAQSLRAVGMLEQTYC